jgi:hypothetical protein
MKMSFELDIRMPFEQLNHAQANLKPAKKEALSEIIKLAKRATADRFVPVKTGFLRSRLSGRVDGSGDGASLRTRNVPYAARQNFNDSFDHKTPMNDTGERGAHFMERGMFAAAQQAHVIIKRMHAKLWDAKSSREFSVLPERGDE